MKVPGLLGLGTLIVLGGVFLLGREGTAPGEPAGRSEQQPDMGYVAEDAEIFQSAADGSPLYALTATRIEQQPASGDARAESIALRYRARDENDTGQGQLWTLVAHSGDLSGGDSWVHLKGNVLVTGKLPGSDRDAQIRTQALDYDTRNQDVRTRLPVSINWGKQKLTARGLSANLKQDSLRLESAVHGRFSP